MIWVSENWKKNWSENHLHTPLLCGPLHSDIHLLLSVSLPPLVYNISRTLTHSKWTCFSTDHRTTVTTVAGNKSNAV